MTVTNLIQEWENSLDPCKMVIISLLTNGKDCQKEKNVSFQQRNSKNPILKGNTLNVHSKKESIDLNSYFQGEKNKEQADEERKIKFELQEIRREMKRLEIEIKKSGYYQSNSLDDWNMIKEKYYKWYRKISMKTIKNVNITYFTYQNRAVIINHGI